MTALCSSARPRIEQRETEEEEEGGQEVKLLFLLLVATAFPWHLCSVSMVLVAQCTHLIWITEVRLCAFINWNYDFMGLHADMQAV